MYARDFGRYKPTYDIYLISLVHHVDQLFYLYKFANKDIRMFVFRNQGVYNFVVLFKYSHKFIW